MIYLDRFKSDENGTFGMLTDGSDNLCFTCELPWKANQVQISCIPPGVYTCQPYSSADHPDVWQVCDVPNRTAILIHTGNTENDSRGCVIVGDSMGTIDGLPAVLNSVKTMEMLKSRLPETFELTITAVNLNQGE